MPSHCVGFNTKSYRGAMKAVFHRRDAEFSEIGVFLHKNFLLSALRASVLNYPKCPCQTFNHNTLEMRLKIQPGSG
jgi:hypothetical protein